MKDKEKKTKKKKFEMQKEKTEFDHFKLFNTGSQSAS